MDLLNIEIKASCKSPSMIRDILKSKQAIYKGTDHQIDTYFNAPNGRLKLREGTIENNLIHYQRGNTKGPKPSKITLFKSAPDSLLKKILTDSLGILTIVDKKREIYFIGNVKFHIDTVENLGNFIEIEAIDKDQRIGEEALLEQCNGFLKLFTISEDQLIAVSYSDLMLQKEK